MRLFTIFMLISLSNYAQDKINSVGSGALNILISEWAEDYKKQKSEAEFFIEGRGNATAIPALISERSEIGPMNRLPNEKEIELFVDKFKDNPKMIAVAYDVLVIYVNIQNPIARRGLTLAELDAIFSSTRKRGYPNNISTWEQLGVVGEFTGKEIEIYGRNPASATYSYFMKTALKKGKFKRNIKNQPGRSAYSVAKDKFSIAYSAREDGLNQFISVPILVNGEKVQPNIKNYESGKYPLTRKLYFAIKPNVENEVKNFLKFILTKQGQTKVISHGFSPLSKNDLEVQLKKLD